MKKIIRMLLWYGLLISLVVGIIEVKIGLPSEYEHFDQLCMVDSGRTLAVFSDEKKNYIVGLDKDLYVQHMYIADRKKGDKYIYIQGIAGYNKQVYKLSLIEKLEDHKANWKQDISSVDFSKNLILKEKKLIDLDPNYYYSYMQVEEDENGTPFLRVIGTNNEVHEKVQEQIYKLSDSGVLQHQETKDYTAEKDKICTFFTYKNRLGYISNKGKLYLSTAAGKFEEHHISGLDIKDKGIYKVLKDSRGTYYAVEQQSGNIRKIDFDNNTSELAALGEEYAGEGTGVQYRNLYDMEIDAENHLIGATCINGKETLLHVSEDEVEQRDDCHISFENLLLYTLKYFGIFYIVFIAAIAAAIGYWMLIRNCRFLWIKLFITIGCMLIALMYGMGGWIRNNYREIITKEYRGSLEMQYNDYKDEAEGVRVMPGDGIDQNYEDIKQDIEAYSSKDKLICMEEEEFVCGTDGNLPEGYRIQYIADYAELQHYKEAYEEDKVIYYDGCDAEGNYMALCAPLIGKSGQKLGLINLYVSQLDIDSYVNEMSMRAGKNIILICIASIAALFIILKIIFRPIYEVEKSLKQVESSNTINPIKYYSKDELFRISKMINTLLQRLEHQNYSLANVNTSYFKFVSKFIFNLLDKKSLSDVHLGDSKRVNAPLCLTNISYPGEVDGDDRILDLNKTFTVIDRVSKQHEGILITDNSELDRFSILYLQDAASALEATLRIAEQLLSEEDVYARNHVTLLDYGETSLILAGTEQRLVPILNSTRRTFLLSQEELLQKTMCKILVTQEFLEQLNNRSAYKYRYIGYLESSQAGKIKLYDFYEQDKEVLKQAKIQTKPLFEAALECFYNSEFYKAKGIFSTIIRDNPEDEIARWYVFRCNELEKAHAEDVDLSLKAYQK